MDPTYPLFPIFAFLGFIVVLIPLPWHLQAWNSGTCAFMIWTAVQCLIAFINCVIWYGSVENFAPVWCDISAQLLLASGIGIPASVLCISRRLHCITCLKTVSVTRRDKRRAVLIDLGIAIGIPILVLVLHTIVHPHRFNIVEDIGCQPVTYNTLPAFFLYYMWPPLLGCVSFVYSGLTLRSFFMRRAQFTSILSTTAAMNLNRYLRLMVLALADMCCTVPLGIYIMYIATHGIPLAPWISWEDTHFDFGRVELVPAFLWRNEKAYAITLELSRWLGPFCAFMFFGLFGFASEAKKHYKLAYTWTLKKIGYKSKPTAAKFALPS
ncbi:STE3-like pheromone receptor [Hymenopellis radicata]|nr:STE3-like pheromone receptor [Hymenopellis radicata]